MLGGRPIRLRATRPSRSVRWATRGLETCLSHSFRPLRLNTHPLDARHHALTARLACSWLAGGPVRAGHCVRCRGDDGEEANRVALFLGLGVRRALKQHKAALTRTPTSPRNRKSNKNINKNVLRRHSISTASVSFPVSGLRTERYRALEAGNAKSCPSLDVEDRHTTCIDPRHGARTQTFVLVVYISVAPLSRRLSMIGTITTLPATRPFISELPRRLVRNASRIFSEEDATSLDSESRQPKKLKTRCKLLDEGLLSAAQINFQTGSDEDVSLRSDHQTKVQGRSRSASNLFKNLN